MFQALLRKIWNSIALEAGNDFGPEVILQVSPIKLPLSETNSKTSRLLRKNLHRLAKQTRFLLTLCFKLDRIHRLNGGEDKTWLKQSKACKTIFTKSIINKSIGG